jgi:hypothetical protein
MATTYADALNKIGASIPPHLIAGAEVPVLTGVQAQGDLLIVPAGQAGMDLFDVEPFAMERVPEAGIQVVVGEATGNTHWLHRGFDSPDVMWARITGDSLVLAVVGVPEGQSAELIHTDEHGANAMGPGCYVIRGKQELADQIRRVAD